MKITKAEIDSFESNGYLVVKDVISTWQIQGIRDAFEIIRGKSKKYGNALYDRKYPDATFIMGDLPSFAELEAFDFLVFNKDIVNIVKSQNLIDIRVPSFLNAKLIITKNSNLVELNSRLNKIDLIEKIYVQEFNKEFILLKIKYLGKLEKIIRKLKEEKIILKIINEKWNIKIL